MLERVDRQVLEKILEGEVFVKIPPLLCARRTWSQFFLFSPARAERAQHASRDFGGKFGNVMSSLGIRVQEMNPRAGGERCVFLGI